MSEYTSINQPSALLPVEGGTLRVENWHGTILEGVALYPFGKDGFDRRRAVLALGMAKEEIAHLGWAPSDFCNGHYLVFSVGPIASIEELLKAERKGTPSSTSSSETTRSSSWRRASRCRRTATWRARGRRRTTA